MNILVVKPSSLGDVVHAFPAVQLLRQHFPDASISWVVNDSYAEIVELYPEVDEVLVFRRRRWAKPRHWLELLGFIRELRQRDFDLVLDFQGLLRSALIARLSGAPRRVGFGTAREGARFLYTERVLLPANIRHAVDRNLFLVRSALRITAELQEPHLQSHHDAVKCAEALMKRHGLGRDHPVVAVAPAARWPTKAWPPGFFATVLSEVAQRVPGMGCWLLGTEDEQATAQAVIAHCKDVNPVDLTGESNLGTLVELIRRTDVLLTNDSGPMHLAAVLGVPTVALFGPTDPSLTGPYGGNHRVFVGTCAHGPCLQRTCPAAARECVNSIPVSVVAEAVMAALRGEVPGAADGDSTPVPEPSGDVAQVP